MWMLVCVWGCCFSKSIWPWPQNYRLSFSMHKYCLCLCMPVSTAKIIVERQRWQGSVGKCLYLLAKRWNDFCSVAIVVVNCHDFPCLNSMSLGFNFIGARRSFLRLILKSIFVSTNKLRMKRNMILLLQLLLLYFHYFMYVCDEVNFGMCMSMWMMVLQL